MLKLEDFKKLTGDIAQNLSDQGKVVDLLRQLEGGFETVFNGAESLRVEHEESQKHIKSLQKTNLDLYLQQGHPIPDETVRNKEQSMSYDDLLKDWKV